MSLNSAAARPLPPAASEALHLISAAQRPLIVFHEHPDGDAIGSALALVLALRKLGKEPRAACPDRPAPCYHFLPGSDEIAGADVAGDFDLALLVDCADLARTGELLAAVRRCPRLVNIDHHPTNERFGDAAWVEPDAAASGELIARLIAALGVPFDAGMATCIFTALLTDTGSFHYSNTTAASLALAGEMVAAGARPDLISDAIYEQHPLGDVELLAAALQTLAVSADGRIAWLTVTAADLARTRGDSDGLVNYARMIAGVEVALLFREEGPDAVKVSLRSRAVDVAAIARAFGGGGHPRAAGCTFRGSLGEAQAVILRHVASAVALEG